MGNTEMLTTNASYTSPGWAYYKYPSSLAPIPGSIRSGLYALCTFSVLSVVTTSSLLIYITYLFFKGGRSHQGALYKNQYVILIYNLLLADLQLALGFVVSIKFLNDNEILAPSAACVIQSWFTNVGDLASGLFVMAIAAHTFLAVVFGRKLEFATFCAVVIGLWVFSVVVTAVPAILHPSDIFVASGNWCSINAKYDVLRLYFHYVWIFLAEFLVLALYAITFIVLRKRLGGIPSILRAKGGATGTNTGTSNHTDVVSAKRDSRSDRKISRAAIFMILYPIAYVLVTLPLAAGRIASLAGNKPSLNYLLIGGSFMTSAGWIDCLLYSLTRSAFLTRKRTSVREMPNRSQRYGINSSAFKGSGVMELSTSPNSPENACLTIPSPVGSMEHIVQDIVRDVRDGEVNENNNTTHGRVKAEMTWEVSSEYIVDENHLEKGGHSAYISTS